MELKAGYKQTEVGVIPVDWEVKIFKDICWVNQGLQIAIEKRLKHPTIYSKIYITIQYLNNAKQIEYIDDYTSPVCCNENDVLMTRTGNTGIVVTGVNGVFHNNFFKINYDKKQITKGYLVYYLNLGKTRKIVLVKAGTSTIPDLNHNDFYSIPIYLPPTLTEQTAIANVLSDTDALIQSLTRLIAKKRQIKQGAMQALLNPYENGRLKAGWVVKKLGEIAEVKSGKRLPLGSYLTRKETHHPYIRVTDMYYGGVHLDEIMFVPEDVYPAIKNYRIFTDDIFISVAGTLGIVGKIPEQLDGANLTENANKVINIQCNRDYLLFVMSSPFVQNVIETERTLGAQPKLALTRIRKFKIPLPPSAKEQTRIATILSDMDTEITALESKLSKYQQIKQGMMQNLLTGQIRLVSPETETNP